MIDEMGPQASEGSAEAPKDEKFTPGSIWKNRHTGVDWVIMGETNGTYELKPAQQKDDPNAPTIARRKDQLEHESRRAVGRRDVGGKVIVDAYETEGDWVYQTPI